jgi:hypothetical protein
MRKPDSKSLVVVRTLLPLPAQALVLTAGGSPSLTYEISKSGWIRAIKENDGKQWING